MEKIWIVIIVFIIWIDDGCLFNGFVSVLNLFKLIIVKVKDDDVEGVVWNGYKSLYIILLNGYFWLSFFKVKLNGMFKVGVKRLYKVKFRIKRFGVVFIFLVLMIIMVIKLFLI